MNMVDEIVKYRELYSTDLAKRLRISDDDKKLPVALSMPALLNPMFGTREYIVGSELMSERQYDMAEDKLLQRMTDILDRTNPLFAPNKEHNEEISNNQGTNGTDDTSSEEEVEEVNIINSNFQKAKQEWSNLKKWTSKQYRPKIDSNSSKTTRLGHNGTRKSIYIGPVLERKKDLPNQARDGKKKNLADYLDERGRMDLVKFFSDFSHIFPTLWILIQCLASIRVVEVGCERFFSLSGYISSPLRTQLGVRTYERLAMLASIVQNVYIDTHWVAQEYLRRCQAGSWKKENTAESLKCWNLERILDERARNTAPGNEITLDELIAEAETEAIVVDND